MPVNKQKTMSRESPILDQLLVDKYQSVLKNTKGFQSNDEYLQFLKFWAVTKKNLSACRIKLSDGISANDLSDLTSLSRLDIKLLALTKQFAAKLKSRLALTKIPIPIEELSIRAGLTEMQKNFLRINLMVAIGVLPKDNTSPIMMTLLMNEDFQQVLPLYEPENPLMERFIFKKNAYGANDLRLQELILPEAAICFALGHSCSGAQEEDEIAVLYIESLSLTSSDIMPITIKNDLEYMEAMFKRLADKLRFLAHRNRAIGVASSIPPEQQKRLFYKLELLQRNIEARLSFKPRFLKLKEAHNLNEFQSDILLFFIAIFFHEPVITNLLQYVQINYSFLLDMFASTLTERLEFAKLLTPCSKLFFESILDEEKWCVDADAARFLLGLTDQNRTIEILIEKK